MKLLNNMFLYLLFYILLLSSHLLAQDQVKTNVAVLDFESQDISLSANKALSNIVRKELIHVGNFNVIDRGNMEQILKEQGFQQTGCTSQECIIAVGRLLGVNKIISGSISKLGQMFIIDLQLTDVERGQIEKLESEKFTGPIEQLIGPISNVTKRLVGVKSTEETATFIYVSSVPTGAKVHINNVFVGSANIKIPISEPGEYKVKITLSGYEDWMQTITVKEGDTPFITATLSERKSTSYDFKGITVSQEDWNDQFKKAKSNSKYGKIWTIVGTPIFLAAMPFMPSSTNPSEAGVAEPSTQKSEVEPNWATAVGAVGMIITTYGIVKWIKAHRKINKLEKEGRSKGYLSVYPNLSKKGFIVCYSIEF